MNEANSDFRISVIIATLGRPDIARFAIERLALQTLRPNMVIVSAVAQADFPDVDDIDLSFEMVVGPKGSCHQRNTGLEMVKGFSEIVLFLDDDFILSRFALEGIQKAFLAFPDVSGMTGLVLADGINSSGISCEEAVGIVDEVDEGHSVSNPAVLREVAGLYGCNMAVRASMIRGERFDEELPLYAWQEDIDFSARIGGRLIQTDAFYGVHCGVKSGRENKGKLLGYSQIANPLYLMTKGTMQKRLALRHMCRNIIANHAKLVAPEPWIDRRGRAVGNWLALRDIIFRRCIPSRILEL